jgi:hypothetical protein
VAGPVPGAAASAAREAAHKMSAVADIFARRRMWTAIDHPLREQFSKGS